MSHNQSKSYIATEVIVKSGKSLYLNEKMADVFFVFKSGERVPAHKYLLAAASDVFDTMFYGSLPEQGDVEIADASAAAFKEFLQIFYLKEVELTMENIGAVMNLGNKYNVAECIELCGQFLERNLTADDVCQIFGLPIVQDQMRLKEECEEKIVKNAEEMFKSNGFIECSRNVLQNILKMDQFSCSESVVFEACMSWTKFASKQNELTKETVKEHLGELFYAIRFRSMTLGQFVDLLTTYKSVFSFDEIYEILQMIRNKKYEPKRFNGNERIPYIEYIEWNEDDVITADRYLSCSEEYLIGNVDITHFTTNKALVLGAFVCSNISRNENGENSEDNVPVDMTIATVHDCVPNGTKTLKVIYSEKFELKPDYDTFIKLQKPIFIRPGIKYEIRLDLQHSVWGANVYKQEVELISGTIINFDYDSNSNGINKGLIDEFHFNRENNFEASN